jgi:PhnB protein
MHFYADAFGAHRLFTLAHPDGRVVHAEMAIGGSVFMLGDADAPFTAPTPDTATTVGLHVYVDNVHRLVGRAAHAGAEVLQPLTDIFYGARTMIVRDPFGHMWVFLTHLEDLSPAQIEQRGTELLAQPRTF